MMKIIYNENSTHTFTDYGIQIPLLNERVTETVKSLNIKSVSFPQIVLEDLSLAHSEEFIKKLVNHPEELVKETYELINKDGSFNRYDPLLAQKPLTDFIEKAKLHVSGTYLAAKQALNHQFVYHLGGGMHHAMSFKPGGFCMFNDIIIAIRKLQKQKKIKKAVVVDLDCHKGDGTAEIARTDDSIKTLSIHMASGWPLDGDPSGPSFIASDFDVAVEKSKNYISQLKKNLKQLLTEDFDLAIVVHGVDVWEFDALPSSNGIKLCRDSVLERDLFVFEMLKAQHIPQAWCLGGGYGPGVSELYIQFLKSC